MLVYRRRRYGRGDLLDPISGYGRRRHRRRVGGHIDEEITGYGRRRRRRRGRGPVKNFFNKAKDFVKKHKVISRAGTLAGILGVPGASTAGALADFAGYGRRRRRRRVRRRRGRGLEDILKGSADFNKRKYTRVLPYPVPRSGTERVHDFLKKHKVISRVGKTLGAIGVPYAKGIGNIADTLGYGRRRRRRGLRRRRIRRIGGCMQY